MAELVLSVAEQDPSSAAQEHIRHYQAEQDSVFEKWSGIVSINEQAKHGSSSFGKLHPRATCKSTVPATFAMVQLVVVLWGSGGSATKFLHTV